MLDLNDIPLTSKDVIFGDEARQKLIAGIDQLANAVKVTLGPGGKNVVIYRKGKAPIVSKDGVTVASHIDLKDAHEDAGAQIVKQTASRTNDVAGDGTTTATVLVQALIHAGQKMIAAGHRPKELKQGIDMAVRDVIQEVTSQAHEVKTSGQIASVGTISANGDTIIGVALAKAMDRVGTQGIITIEDAKGVETSLELVDGIRLDRGYTSPYFVNDVERMQVTFDDPYVLVTDRNFKTMVELIPILEAVQKEAKPILIIANDVEGEALKLLTANKMQGKLQCCVIVAPGRGEHRVNMLGDIATMLGATYISEADGRKGADIKLEDLGTCSKVTVNRTHTTLIRGMGDLEERDERKQTIENLLKDPTNDELTKQRLQERASIMGGAAAIIKVGGATEVELGERKDRIVDALNATQAAAEEGIVPGGGIALYRAAKKLSGKTWDVQEQYRHGYEIVLKACEAPIRQILENAGHNPDRMMTKIEDSTNSSLGYNAVSGEVIDMFEGGVIDPVKVTRSALENAASVGGIVLTLGASIVDC